MPHITIKMLKGRSEEQKELAVKKVAEALKDALGCSDSHISVSVKDYSAQEWQSVFAEEIAGEKDLFKKPDYDPKDMLK